MERSKAIRRLAIGGGACWFCLSLGLFKVITIVVFLVRERERDNGGGSKSYIRPNERSQQLELARAGQQFN